jgi:hypothetical protein
MSRLSLDKIVSRLDKSAQYSYIVPISNDPVDAGRQAYGTAV